MTNLSNNIPISLYIHIPWCVRKCPYCDFNSHAAKGPLPEEEYVDTLIADLRHDLSNYEIKRPLHTIFFGGGTPSLFSAKSIARILEAVNAQWGLTTSTEITLEANPGTIEHTSFTDLRQAGVTRVSLGIQSFDDAQLQRLGRIHSAEEAVRAVEALRTAGFINFNVDLMFGLPEQTLTQGLDDLQQAIALAPPHLSWYQLTLEPNTVFYKKPPRLPDHDAIADLHEQGQALLAQQGYAGYEISAYAQPHHRCAHNLNYWQFGDYLGIGAGAHGKITRANGEIIRTRKVKQPQSYLTQENVTAEIQLIALEQRAFEFMLNGLRLQEPISLELFKQRTGLEFTHLAPILEEAYERGFLERQGDRLYKTELGERFTDDLLQLFLL